MGILPNEIFEDYVGSNGFIYSWQTLVYFGDIRQKDQGKLFMVDPHRVLLLSQERRLSSRSIPP